MKFFVREEEKMITNLLNETETSIDLMPEDEEEDDDDADQSLLLTHLSTQ